MIALLLLCINVVSFGQIKTVTVQKKDSTKNDFTLDKVEVSNSTNANKTLLYQPASISHLNETDIKRGVGIFFDDAIQTNVTGVLMNRRSVGGGQQFNIRGYGNGARGKNGASSNFDGQGYKLYLNGIPVTDAEGITTMDDIDFGTIAKAEIVKGPAGSLYGQAIAGAVNLRTIQPEKNKTSLSQDIIVGNYGLRRNDTRFQTASDRHAVLLNYGHQETEGFAIHNASRKDYASLTYTFTPTEKEKITAYFGYANSYDQRVGELTPTQFDAGDYSGNIEYIKRDGHSNVTTFRAGVTHEYQFNKHISAVNTVYGATFASNVSSAGGWTDKSSGNYGLRSSIQTQWDLTDAIKLSGLTGIETQRQDAWVVGYSMKQNPLDTASTWKLGVNPYWVINAITADVNSVSLNQSVFSEWTLSLPKDFAVTAGVGSSKLHFTLNDRFNPAIATRPAKFDTTYNNMVSPHIAINKIINKHLSVYASYSKGYKAPTTSYFYITTPAVTTPATPATGRLNNQLSPEVGTQIEYGTKGQLFNNLVVFEFAYFHTLFENKMTAISVASPANRNTTLYSYVVNGGRQSHYGVEGAVRVNLINAPKSPISILSPFVNFTHSDFTYANHFTIQKSVTSIEDYTGKWVAGVPKWIANAGIDFAMQNGLYANMTYNYRDKMPIDGLNTVFAPSYNLLNGKIGFATAVSKHIKLDAYAGVNNITGAKYYLMAFSNQLPDAYTPAPKDAMYFGGLQLKYEF